MNNYYKEFHGTNIASSQNHCYQTQYNTSEKQIK